MHTPGSRSRWSWPRSRPDSPGVTGAARGSLLNVERSHLVTTETEAHAQLSGAADSVNEARPLPTWLVTALVAAVVWCAAAGAVGLALLMAGWYDPAVVGAAAALGAVAAALTTSRRLGRRADA